MKFLFDNQLPLAPCRFITARGNDCQPVLDVGLAQAPDLAIWDYAHQEGRVIISKDEDFFHLAGLPEAKGRLVWVRSGNCRTTVLLRELDRVWSHVVAPLEAGERVVEIR